MSRQTPGNGLSETIYILRKLHKTNISGMPRKFDDRAPSSGRILLNVNLPFELNLRKSEVVFWCLRGECWPFWKINEWKFIQIHQWLYYGFKVPCERDCRLSTCGNIYLFPWRRHWLRTRNKAIEIDLKGIFGTFDWYANTRSLSIQELGKAHASRNQGRLNWNEAVLIWFYEILPNQIRVVHSLSHCTCTFI